jgi:hypothetical protein
MQILTTKDTDFPLVSDAELTYLPQLVCQSHYTSSTHIGYRRIVSRHKHNSVLPDR